MLLLCADLTIVDALNLGDKLQSLLYYHFLPSAYTGPQLADAQSLNTDLGISTGTPYNLTFGTAPDGRVRNGICLLKFRINNASFAGIIVSCQHPCWLDVWCWVTDDDHKSQAVEWHGMAYASSC